MKSWAKEDTQNLLLQRSLLPFQGGDLSRKANIPSCWLRRITHESYETVNLVQHQTSLSTNIIVPTPSDCCETSMLWGGSKQLSEATGGSFWALDLLLQAEIFCLARTFCQWGVVVPQPFWTTKKGLWLMVSTCFTIRPEKLRVIYVDLSGQIEAASQKGLKPPVKIGNVCSAAVQFRLLLSEVPLHLTVWRYLKPDMSPSLTAVHSSSCKRWTSPTMVFFSSWQWFLVLLEAPPLLSLLSLIPSYNTHTHNSYSYSYIFNLRCFPAPADQNPAESKTAQKFSWSCPW